MKKIPLIIGPALIAIILVVIYSGKFGRLVSYDFKQNSNSESLHRPSLTNIDFDSYASGMTRKPRVEEDPASEIEKLKLELDLAKAELDQLNRPLNEDMLSSAVNAEINPGDTLVSGGYKKDDGNYEITLLTPISVTLSDGTESIEIHSKALSARTEFVNENELDSLATNAANTLQHGESWTEDEVRSKLLAAGDYRGSETMSLPKMVCRPSEPFEISVTRPDGSQFAIRGKVAKNANGKFSIQSRVERTTETAQVTPSLDH